MAFSETKGSEMLTIEELTNNVCRNRRPDGKKAAWTKLSALLSELDKNDRRRRNALISIASDDGNPCQRAAWNLAKDEYLEAEDLAIVIGGCVVEEDIRAEAWQRFVDNRNLPTGNLIRLSVRCGSAKYAEKTLELLKPRLDLQTVGFLSDIMDVTLGPNGRPGIYANTKCDVKPEDLSEIESAWESGAERDRIENMTGFGVLIFACLSSSPTDASAAADEMRWRGQWSKCVREILDALAPMKSSE